jgi:hypothetical protein
MRIFLRRNTVHILATTSIAISAKLAETNCDYNDNEDHMKTLKRKVLSTKESDVPLSRNFVANAANSISPAVVNISKIITIAYSTGHCLFLSNRYNFSYCLTQSYHYSFHFSQC